MEEEKLVIYRRVSVEDKLKGRNGQSIDSQKTNCLEYIKKHYPTYNISNVKVYTDDGISAGKEREEREDLMRLMVDVKNLKVTKIFITRQDRFIRKLRDLDLYETLTHLGVELITIENGQNLTDKTPIGQFFRNLQILLAEFELALTSERQKETKEGMFYDGRFRGGFLPYGFEWQYDKSITDEKIIQAIRELKVIPNEKEVYRKILHKFFNENKGATVISKELNLEGIEFRTGEKTKLTTGENSWTSSNVLDVLKNPLWFGKQAKNKYRFVTIEGKKSRQRINPREWELQPISNLKENVIDEETFWKIIDKLENRQVGGDMESRRTQTSWLLSSILVCECGSNMVTEHPRANYKYYACPNVKCKIKRFNKFEMEQEALNLIVKEIKSKAENFELQEKVIARLAQELEISTINIEQTKNEIKIIDSNKDDLQKEFLVYKDNPQKRDSILEMIGKLDIRKNELNEILAFQNEKLNQNTDEAFAFKDSLNAIAMMGKAFQTELYDDKDLINIQRALFLSFVEKFYIEDDSLKISFRKPNESIPKYLTGRFDKDIYGIIGEVMKARNEVSATVEEVNKSLESMMGVIHELQPRFIQTDVLISNVLATLTDVNN